MTVIEWTLIAGVIGVPVGFIFGIIAIFGILLNSYTDWLEVFLWYIGIQIFSPIFMMVMMFICLGWFSLFINDLNMW